MARKTKPAALQREETPEFLAALAALPADREAMIAVARAALDLFNDAIRGAASEQVALAQLRYDAVIYRLNGDTFAGRAEAGSISEELERTFACEPGQVPSWGQRGEWLLDLGLMRIRVVYMPWSLYEASVLELHAVDADGVFISNGVLSQRFIHFKRHLGSSLGVAVRRELEDALSSGLKPQSIGAEFRALVKVPAWLSQALAGVTRNGQLAMPIGGESLPPAEKKVPLSNAERQREFRRRQAAKAAAAKAEGLRTVQLSRDDDSLLWCGLNSFFTLEARSDFLNSPAIQADLERIFRGSPIWTEGNRAELGKDKGVINRDKHLRSELARGWDCYKAEVASRVKVVAELAAVQAENDRLVSELKSIAGELSGPPAATPALVSGKAVPINPSADVAALQEEIASLRKALEFEKNERALMLDERNCGHTAVVETLRSKIVGLERSNAQEVADRAKAFEAVEVLQARLKKAGLVSDYRRQPGE